MFLDFSSNVMENIPCFSEILHMYRNIFQHARQINHLFIYLSSIIGNIQSPLGNIHEHWNKLPTNVPAVINNHFHMFIGSLQDDRKLQQAQHRGLA
jgi:hypothetical protein